MSDDESRDDRESRGPSEAEEIKEIFGALSDSIPKLIGGLIGSVYSPERAEDMAAAIGGFYTKLKEQGIPDEMAMELTKKYVAGLDMFNITNLMNIAMEGEKGKKKTKSVDLNDFEDDEDLE
ncbi:MAG: hypothetical protein AM324_013410 [Candidatus Thorarchaeota archaeon SMTZ1-83]|nr:MAG: hypothetical protein AM324_14550 [Candidatus Thorarchaeota archaeon SMTZ1-83]